MSSSSSSSDEDDEDDDDDTSYSSEPVSISAVAALSELFVPSIRSGSGVNSVGSGNQLVAAVSLTIGKVSRLLGCSEHLSTLMPPPSSLILAVDLVPGFCT